VTDPTLREEWAALLERRPTFREPLAPYALIFEAWAAAPGRPLPPLQWSPEECRARWQRGVPLLVDSRPAIPPAAMEELVAAALEFLATVSEEGEALQRFAEAWDRGTVPPEALFPERGRLGSAALQGATGLSPEALGFVASASLRPILAAYFTESRAHLTPGVWDLGVCPFCGAPPGFGDLREDGQRVLACHVCAAGWGFARLQCPYCGSRRPQDLVRLQGEEREEGYLISACQACHGYLKELDRRVRWNAGSALVEDWGSPHLDLVARRKEYWRGIPTLIQLQPSTPA
jgi:FdhE protein